MIATSAGAASSEQPSLETVQDEFSTYDVLRRVSLIRIEYSSHPSINVVVVVVVIIIILIIFFGCACVWPGLAWTNRD